MAKEKAPAAPKSQFKHVEYLDVNEDGVLEEVAVVKRWKDGSLSYIDIATLDQIDKGRLKKIVSSQHADKYELWDLLSQATLSNGMNALDYFHSNLVRVLKGKGSVATIRGGGLGSAKDVSSEMVGAGFTNPGELADEGAEVTIS